MLEQSDQGHPSGRILHARQHADRFNCQRRVAGRNDMDQRMNRSRPARKTGGRGPHAPPLFLVGQLQNQRFNGFFGHLKRFGD